MRNTIIKIFAAIAVSITIPLVLECIFRLAGPQPELLDQILSILQPDRELFWTLRPDLSVKFQQAKLTTSKDGFRTNPFPQKLDPKETRILVLGASPTFGWGVNDGEEWPAKIQNTLRKSGKKAMVYNVAVPGYTTFQGLKLAKRLIPKIKPQYVLIAFILNDMDRFRFFGTDGKTDADHPVPSYLSIAIGDLRSKSRAFPQLVRLLAGLRQVEELPPPGQRRVPPEHYLLNLKTLSELAKSQGARPIFLKEPVNLPYANDETSQHVSQSQLQEIKNRIRRDNIADALRQAQEIAKAHPADPEIYRVLINAQKAAGQKKEAAKSLARLQYVSNFAGGVALKYQGLIQEAATKTNTQLIDVASAFEKHTGSYLYNDPVKDSFHPNAAGHELIASLILSSVFP